MWDYDAIETPENIVLERRLAGIGSRFLAGLIDVLWMTLVTIILFLLVMFASFALDFDITDIWIVSVLLIIYIFLMYWGYFAYFEYKRNGSTPGKRRLQIRVVTESGEPLTFSHIAIRNLLRVVDFLPASYIVGGICMFCTKRMQRLGDLAAGTLVISEERGNYSAKSDSRISTTPGKHHVAVTEEASAEKLRVTQLLPQEYKALDNYRQRRYELTLEARQRILPQLLGPILQRLGQPVNLDDFYDLEYRLDELMSPRVRPDGIRPPTEKTDQSAISPEEENHT